MILRELEASELETRRAISRILGPILALADETVALLSEVLSGLAQHPPVGKGASAGKVCLIIGARITNDLRACSLLSRLGYGLQAMGLAASLVEHAGAIAYIGVDDQRAIEWARHVDQKHSYPPQVKIGLEALSKASEPSGSSSQEMVERWYSIYQTLCMAKHGNPVLSLSNGLRFDSLGPFFGWGPDGSRSGVEISRSAIYQAVLFSLEGSFVCLTGCADPEVASKLADRVKDMIFRVYKVDSALADLMELLPQDES